MPRRHYVTSNFKTKEICPYESPYSYDKDHWLTHNEIPVRKILVANIKPTTTHQILKKRFESYGEIVDCNLKKKSSLNSYAFITFKDSTSASSAINKGYHKEIFIGGQYLRVLPAAAWHQPDRNKSANNESIKIIDIEENDWSAHIHYSSNNESPIAKLNEYCLMHIFGFLPFRDRIRVERVCRYWQIVSKESLYSYKKFDSILSTDNWRYIRNAPTLYKILEKFGFYVTRICDLNKHEFIGNSTLIAIAMLCPNIEEINLSNFPFLASGIKALAKNCTKIKHITIGKSSHESYNNVKYDKELSALFSKNRSLQNLDLNGDIINGPCLKHLSTKHITHISLTKQNCVLFIPIISKIQNLFELEIHSCSNVDILLQAQSFKLNAEYIEKLSITADGYRSIVNLNVMRAVKEDAINYFIKSSDLKNLKHLNLRHSPLGYITDELLLNIGEKFNQQLTYLDISGAKGLTNSGLICIVTSLSKLEHFYMSDMHKTVTDEIFCCGMPNLRTLTCSRCLGIQDEGLIKFINNSEKLQKLDVRFCPLITNKLILAAIEYTNRKKNEIMFINAKMTRVNIKTLKENSPLLEFMCNTGSTPSFCKQWDCKNLNLN